jgi:hypothetical protein
MMMMMILCTPDVRYSAYAGISKDICTYFVLGISANGFPGRVSDRKVTSDCGILRLLEPGDQIMADRGFDVGVDLPAGAILNIPAFMNGQNQLIANRMKY